MDEAETRLERLEKGVPWHAGSKLGQRNPLPGFPRADGTEPTREMAHRGTDADVQGGEGWVANFAARHEAAADAKQRPRGLEPGSSLAAAGRASHAGGRGSCRRGRAG
ncbi:uncharacterized protein UV8b_07563 [Ustilaginoidea virens]|uniref:Uncharacterized protein n=1 Tax=Ustilaginoidea virens TaxID=1159556 RepID=A0A8E5HXJ9_USTVR|nr:uncharacterized protein UV8b_07563 [Ustilaginoidea virens]QUC23322.1 hypothetical protein UV8b_07563 [Ustilaginoidea virens]